MSDYNADRTETDEALNIAISGEDRAGKTGDPPCHAVRIGEEDLLSGKDYNPWVNLFLRRIWHLKAPLIAVCILVLIQLPMLGIIHDMDYWSTGTIAFPIMLLIFMGIAASICTGLVFNGSGGRGGKSISHFLAYSPCRPSCYLRGIILSHAVMWLTFLATTLLCWLPLFLKFPARWGDLLSCLVIGYLVSLFVLFVGELDSLYLMVVTMGTIIFSSFFSELPLWGIALTLAGLALIVLLNASQNLKPVAEERSWRMRVAYIALAAAALGFAPIISTWLLMAALSLGLLGLALSMQVSLRAPTERQLACFRRAAWARYLLCGFSIGGWLVFWAVFLAAYFRISLSGKEVDAFWKHTAAWLWCATPLVWSYFDVKNCRRGGTGPSRQGFEIAVAVVILLATVAVWAVSVLWDLEAKQVFAISVAVAGYGGVLFSMYPLRRLLAHRVRTSRVRGDRKAEGAPRP